MPRSGNRDHNNVITYITKWFIYESSYWYIIKRNSITIPFFS